MIDGAMALSGAMAMGVAVAMGLAVVVGWRIRTRVANRSGRLAAVSEVGESGRSAHWTPPNRGKRGRNAP